VCECVYAQQPIEHAQEQAEQRNGAGSIILDFFDRVCRAAVHSCADRALCAVRAEKNAQKHVHMHVSYSINNNYTTGTTATVHLVGENVMHKPLLCALQIAPRHPPLAAGQSLPSLCYALCCSALCVHTHSKQLG